MAEEGREKEGGETMTCPSCRRAALSMSSRCECGYAFQGPQTEIAPVLGSIDRSVRTVKNILLWWFFLTIAGALAWIIMRLVS